MSMEARAIEVVASEARRGLEFPRGLAILVGWPDVMSEDAGRGFRFRDTTRAPFETEVGLRFDRESGGGERIAQRTLPTAAVVEAELVEDGRQTGTAGHQLGQRGVGVGSAHRGSFRGVRQRGRRPR